MDGILILQEVTTGSAIIGIFVEAYFDKGSTDSKKKWVTRGISVAALVFGMLVVFYARRESAHNDLVLQQQIERQKEQLSLSKDMQLSQKDQISQSKELAHLQQQVIESQKQQILLSGQLLDAQGRGIQQLNLLSLDRAFSGIEISYKPTTDEWSRVARIYQKIPPPDEEASYHESPIVADRVGVYWKVDFEPVSVEGGTKWFAPVSTEEPNNKGFEQIIREGTMPLMITWGTGLETKLEPWRSDYPSGISLSPKLFAIRLRPPLLEINLASLQANSTIMLRSRTRPSDLTFHSLDPGVILNQTVHLKWREEVSHRFRDSLFPYVSGPHRLDLTFRNISK